MKKWYKSNVAMAVIANSLPLKADNSNATESMYEPDLREFTTK